MGGGRGGRDGGRAGGGSAAAAASSATAAPSAASDLAAATVERRARWLRQLAVGSTVDVQYHGVCYARPHWYEGIVVAVDRDDDDEDGDGDAGTTAAAAAAADCDVGASPAPTVVAAAGDAATATAAGAAAPASSSPLSTDAIVPVPRTRRWVVVHCLAFPFSRVRVRVAYNGSRRGGSGVGGGFGGSGGGGVGGVAGRTRGGGGHAADSSTGGVVKQEAKEANTRHPEQLLEPETMAEHVLAPAYTKVRNWRQQLRTGTAVEVHKSLLPDSSSFSRNQPQRYEHMDSRSTLIRKRIAVMVDPVWTLMIPNRERSVFSFAPANDLEFALANCGEFSLPFGERVKATCRR